MFLRFISKSLFFSLQKYEKTGGKARGKLAFLCLARTASYLRATKIVKGESSAKEKLVFLGIAEPPQSWAQPKIAKGEREGKEKLAFSSPCPNRIPSS